MSVSRSPWNLLTDPAYRQGSPTRLARLFGIVLFSIATLLATATAARAESAGGGVRSALSAQLDLGSRFGCAIQQNGDVRCWGHGQYGKLGSRATDSRLDGVVTGGTDAASTVPLGGPAKAVSASRDNACAVLVSGVVRCWGRGGLGVLGTGLTDNRLDGIVTGGTDEASTVPLGAAAAVSVSVGYTHACALLETGAIRCWGDGSYGQLGTGATDKRLDGVIDPVSGTDAASIVTFAEPAIQVVTGVLHTCALLTSGTVRCWGYSAYGNLGSGFGDARLDGIIDAQSGTDEASTPITGAVALSGKGETTCATLTTGATRCWGANEAGQAGAGTLTDVAGGAANPPSTVPIEPTGSGVGTNSQHVCAVVADGVVRCWGDSTYGQVGALSTDRRLDGIVDPGTGTDAASTVPLPGPAAAVVAGEYASCALLRNGAVHCWGWGAAGQLGTGSTVTRLNSPTVNTTTTPVLIDPLFGRLTKQSVAISAPASPQPGVRFEVSVKVTNDGPDAALATHVDVDLPGSLEVLDATTADGSFAAPTWTIPAIPAGGEVLLTLGVQLAPTPAGGPTEQPRLLRATRTQTASATRDTAPTSAATDETEITPTDPPAPDPTPGTTPDPAPGTTPNPDPTPGTTPDPDPTPGTTPDPAPGTTPNPDPAPTTTPDPDPSPGTTPDPDPAPSTTPDPAPGTTPDPDPTAGPDPTPQPALPGATEGIVPRPNAPETTAAPITRGSTAPVALTTSKVAVRGHAQLAHRRLTIGQRTTLTVRLANTSDRPSTATRTCTRLSKRLKVVRRPTASTLKGDLLCFAIPTLQPGESVERTARLLAVNAARGAITRDGLRDQTAVEKSRIVIDAVPSLATVPGR